MTNNEKLAAKLRMALEGWNEGERAGGHSKDWHNGFGRGIRQAIYELDKLAALEARDGDLQEAVSLSKQFFREEAIKKERQLQELRALVEKAHGSWVSLTQATARYGPKTISHYTDVWNVHMESIDATYAKALKILGATKAEGEKSG